MDQTKKKRVAVVGAGIAGLTCAYELKKAGVDVTVFEKNAYVGGRMASREKDGFVFDIGADHLCDLYVEMKKYCEEFGIAWERMRFLRYAIFKNGQVVRPSEAIGKLSKLRLAIQHLRNRDVADFFHLNHLATHDVDDARAFMLRRTGKEVVDYFVDPFTSTYQFHRADEISLGALLGVMHSVANDQEGWHLHRTEGGMSALPEAFASRLDVRLETPALKVKGGERVVVTSSGGDESFDAVVLASQASASLQMLEAPSEAQRDVLEKTRYASTVSVAFEVPLKLLPDIAVVWVPFVESEKISGYVNEAMKGKELIAGDKTLVSVWLHEGFAKEIINKTDEEIFAAVREEFLRVCPWFEDAVDLKGHDLERWEEAMPKFYHGHLARVNQFLEKEQGRQHIFLAGDYMNAPWTEGALRGGQRTAKEVLEQLA